MLGLYESTFERSDHPRFGAGVRGLVLASVPLVLAMTDVPRRLDPLERFERMRTSRTLANSAAEQRRVNVAMRLVRAEF